MTPTYLHWFLPYCLIRLQEPDVYVVLNRAYKPLGSPTEHWAVYENHAVQLQIAPHIVEQLRENDDDSNRIYLYDDTTDPSHGGTHWRAYLLKLSLLADVELQLLQGTR